MLIAARNWAAQTFLIKILLKSNDFDCPGWPRAAGMEKSMDFQLKSYEKATILIAQAGRERPERRKVSIFN